MHEDRGMIKWAPFNSVTSSKDLLESISKEKKKVSKPILSDEQKNYISEKIIENYYEHIPLKFDYFDKGEIIYSEDYIKKIDQVYHKVYLSTKIILLEQIVKIY